MTGLVAALDSFSLCVYERVSKFLLFKKKKITVYSMYSLMVKLILRVGMLIHITDILLHVLHIYVTRSNRLLVHANGVDNRLANKYTFDM